MKLAIERSFGVFRRLLNLEEFNVIRIANLDILWSRLDSKHDSSKNSMTYTIEWICLKEHFYISESLFSRDFLQFLANYFLYIYVPIWKNRLKLYIIIILTHCGIWAKLGKISFTKHTYCAILTVECSLIHRSISNEDMDHNNTIWRDFLLRK